MYSLPGMIHKQLKKRLSCSSRAPSSEACKPMHGLAANPAFRSMCRLLTKYSRNAGLGTRLRMGVHGLHQRSGACLVMQPRAAKPYTGQWQLKAAVEALHWQKEQSLRRRTRHQLKQIL